MKIEIRQLSKSFESLELFKNLNLDIEHGQITCLYGMSGCGKTTLLNMIGFVESYKGEIIYDGNQLKSRKDVKKMLREKVGFIFQEFGLIENETVYSNLKIVKKIRKMKKEDVKSALEKLNIGELLDKKVYKLSGGEKQRVAIAKIMIKDVDLVLADEPTGSIDDENARIVIDLLKQMREQGKTVIISSHDHRIRDIADTTIDVQKFRNK